MTTDMPPPPQQSGTNWLRAGGIITALSAPISGFVLYALAAALIGEDRLEDEGGLTTLGFVPFVVPAVIGMVLFGLSFTGRSGPSGRVVGAAVAVIALVCAGAGVLALVNADAGDASIGGGLLIIAALVLAGLATVLLRARTGAVAGSDQSPRL